MTLQFGAKQNITHGLVEAVDHSPVNWWRDLAAHGALKEECSVATDRQTRLMEYIRTGVDPQPCCTEGQPRSPSWAPQGSLDRIGQNVDEFVSVDAAKEELAALDAHVQDMRNEMRQLETILLTRDPETPAEASALLKFVADMLFAGTKLDMDYLADLLESCADGIGTAKAPRPSVPNRPSASH